MNINSILNSIRPVSLYEKEDSTNETSFHKELTGIMSERASDGSLPADNADLSELTAPCGCEITEAGHDETEEAEEA